MEVPENRKWMNNRVDCHKNITAEFNIGVHEFIMFALAQDKNNIGGGNIRCPCKNCKCMKFGNPEEVKEHLCRRGFMSDYYHWTNHGEAIPPIPIHLAYEARVGGPVQYRWMYPFERFIRTLKQKVTNQARVEGSICKAYLLEEMSTFASYYYPPDVPSRRTRVPRNDDGGEDFSMGPPLSIFNYPGRPFGKSTTSTLDDKEMKAAHLYILLNCPEVVPYLDMHSDLLRELDPQLNETDLDKQVSASFPTWFKTYVLDSRNMIDDVLLRSLAWGPIREVVKWSGYVINGYKFVTKSRNEGMSTTNHNVCVRGGQFDSLENDYYGVLNDIVELEYTGHPTKKVVLFQCDWFDPSSQGTKMDDYGNVEIKKSRRYQNYDPFVLSQQADQVYFTSFPEGQQGWLGVIKTKARSTIQSMEKNKHETTDAYQDDDVHQIPIVISNDDDDFHQCHEDEDEDEDEDEEEEEGDEKDEEEEEEEEEDEEEDEEEKEDEGEEEEEDGWDDDDNYDYYGNLQFQ
ncbi:uncharacterized protein LOC131605484 [Vicia villosa]|uniref:uncharacterized protein LOC131605484 n=1 Tax=Vicia villosa TaxID=3911 RepID=UPI00273B1336|nr:uncharacterized protein LOC131605484 [Vicia villosa]